MGRGIWEEASGWRHLGGGIWEECGTRHLGGGIWVEASGRMHLGGSIWEKASGGGICEEASGRRHLGGGIWGEAFGRTLGVTLGELWGGSGKALGRLWEDSGKGLGALVALEAPGTLGGLWEVLRWLWRLWRLQGCLGGSLFINRHHSATELNQKQNVAFTKCF